MAMFCWGDAVARMLMNVASSVPEPRAATCKASAWSAAAASSASPASSRSPLSSARHSCSLAPWSSDARRSTNDESCRASHCALPARTRAWDRPTRNSMMAMPSAPRPSMAESRSMTSHSSGVETTYVSKSLYQPLVSDLRRSTRRSPRLAWYATATLRRCGLARQHSAVMRSVSLVPRPAHAAYTTSASDAARRVPSAPCSATSASSVCVSSSTPSSAPTARCVRASRHSLCALIQAMEALRKRPEISACSASLSVRLYLYSYASHTVVTEGLVAQSRPASRRTRMFSDAPKPFMAFSRRIAMNISGLSSSEVKPR
mmetsp:Transcript_15825/g.53321  ORF Transcript_15825/g.53321 Transcript_15825/m.53321 type:complete len:317 (+) Transcript_15825:457-1407(+)